MTNNVDNSTFDIEAFKANNAAAVARRKRIEKMNQQHDGGYHTYRKYGCPSCATRERINQQSDAYLVTEAFAQAFSPAPIPKGFL